MLIRLLIMRKLRAMFWGMRLRGTGKGKPEPMLEGKSDAIVLQRMVDRCLRWVLPKHTQPGLSVQEVVDEDIWCDESMLTVQSTCSFNCRREHGVQTDDGGINSLDKVSDLAIVCKMFLLLPRCNEDLNIFCECLDTFSAWRLDGTNPAIFVWYKVVVVIKGLMERSAIEWVEDDVFRQRLLLFRECRDSGNCLGSLWEGRKMYLDVRVIQE